VSAYCVESRDAAILAIFIFRGGSGTRDLSPYACHGKLLKIR
jgi:hypothetical protein